MIRIDVLGGLRVTHDALSADSLLTQRLRSCLLAYLAIERDVSREAVLRVFWADREPEKARHLLSQMLYELRGELGDDWIEVRGERLLATVALSSDAVEFEQLAAAGHADLALPLYRGPFLQNAQLAESTECEHWVDGRRAHYGRIYRKLVRAHIAQLASEGKLERAGAVALGAAEAEPLEDEFHHAVIELLARSGKRAEALAHYERYERLLQSEQLTPLDETRQLIADIRADRVEAAPRWRLWSRAQPVETFGSAPSQQRRILGVAALVAVVAVSALLWTAFHPDASDAALGADLLPDRAAVLPFEAIGRGRSAIDVAGFRGELINELSRSPQLEIAPKVDVDRATAGSPPLIDVAHLTRSLLLVTGSFTMKDSLLTLSLIFWDGATGRRLGMRSLQSSAVDGAALQRQAVDYLSEELVRNLEFLGYRRETRNTRAWQIFNDALQRYRNFDVLFNTGEYAAALRGLLVSDSMAARADALDKQWVAPTLLRIQVLRRVIFLCRATGLTVCTPAQTDAYVRSALALAERGAARFPDNIDVLEERGISRYELWRWQVQAHSVNDIELRNSAERDLGDVIAADAKRARARMYAADILSARARFREEKEMALQALAVDPTAARDQRIFYRLAMASLELGQETEALEWCGKGRQRFPGDESLMYCELTVRAYGNVVAPDVARSWQIVRELGARPQPMLVPLFEMLMASVLARAGLPDSARSVAARASAQAPGAVSLMWPEAVLWTRLGDYDRAVRILEEDGRRDPAWTKRTLLSHAFKPLHNHPAFQRLLAQYTRNPD